MSKELGTNRKKHEGAYTIHSTDTFESMLKILIDRLKMLECTSCIACMCTADYPFLVHRNIKVFEGLNVISENPPLSPHVLFLKVKKTCLSLKGRNSLSIMMEASKKITKVAYSCQF